MAKKTKIARLGIRREPGYLYFVKGTTLYKTERGRKGGHKKVASFSHDRDDNFVYFLDRDGDVARAARAARGGRRRKKASKTTKRRTTKRTTTKRRRRAASPARKRVTKRRTTRKAPAKKKRASKKKLNDRFFKELGRRLKR